MQEVEVLATNGTFTLIFDGQPTGPLQFNATETDVQTALNNLPNIGLVGGSVTVVRTDIGSGFRYTVTFGGTLANANLPQMDVAVTGGVFAVVTTALDGSEGTVVADGATLQVGGNITVTGEKVTIFGDGFNGQGALNNFSGTNTWAIPLTLGSDATIGSTIAGDVLRFTAPITDEGNAFDLDIVGPGIVEYAGHGGQPVHRHHHRPRGRPVAQPAERAGDRRPAGGRRRRRGRGGGRRAAPQPDRRRRPGDGELRRHLRPERPGRTRSAF